MGDAIPNIKMCHLNLYRLYDSFIPNWVKQIGDDPFIHLTTRKCFVEYLK